MITMAALMTLVSGKRKVSTSAAIRDHRLAKPELFTASSMAPLTAHRSRQPAAARGRTSDRQCWSVYGSSARKRARFTAGESWR